MNRTLKLKLLYVAAFLTLGSLSLWIIMTLFPGRELVGAMLVGLVLLVPGRIQGFVYRDLFRGRRLYCAGRPKEAAGYFQTFIAELRRKPWKKRFIWFSWTFYTTDVEAMAWNNLGAAMTSMGKWTEAKKSFEAALATDAKYPLPYLNLARIAIVEEDRAQAERRIQQAMSLGYRSTTVDQLIYQSQALLAKIEGRGAAKPTAGT